ncbi:MAG: hypothetical protein Q8Q48_04110 [Candidatus Staskawiczbacteria bacterium]|nr:hypothetical protein [Candidatus Staskawiczbacteria bacterium]
MKNETFIDKVLQKDIDQKIMELHNKGYSPREIMHTLFISEDYVKEVVDGHRYAERAERDAEDARHQ